MSPKSGKAGTADSPADPKEALEAIDGKPGDVTTTEASPQQKQAGNWGQVKTSSGDDSDDGNETSRNSWISIELKDDKGHPMAGEEYEIKLSDGSITGGSLDDKGKARVEGIPSGQCEVRFPRLHNSEWRKA